MSRGDTHTFCKYRSLPGLDVQEGIRRDPSRKVAGREVEVLLWSVFPEVDQFFGKRRWVR